MKKLLFVFAAATTLSTSFAQKEVKYKDAKIETEYVTINATDAVSNDAYTKFKLKITNKTNDYIIFKPEESKLIINGNTLVPKERWLILEPNESGSRVIDFKGSNFYTAKNYTYVLDGLYKASLNGNSIPAPDFKLPPSQNEFKAGNFTCTLLNVSKKTDKTAAKFKCSYNGDKIGFINPDKAAAKMPDGSEWAIKNSKVKPSLLKNGEDDNFVLVWEDIAGGKSMDMQLVNMIILWHDAFSESAPEKIKNISFEMQDVLNPNTSAQSSPPVKTVEEPAVTTTKQADESLYRGSGDPLKGLNIAKSKEMVIGNYYAVVIGIDKYKGKWPPLQNAVNDAKAIETTLKAKYKFDYFHVLYNEQATRKSVISELEWLAANAKENDNVFIYYSGHGEYKQDLNKGFWVPVDAMSTSTADYISNNDIQTYITGIKSKHTLLVSDACFSGDIFRGNTISVPFEDSEKYYKEVQGLSSRQAMTSGGIEPVMDGGKNGHSVFAYYLLKSLNENQSKYYDVGQLYNQIKIPVVNNSDQTPKLSPVKDTGDEGGQFIFIKK
jgi:hypothetical protein